MRLFIALPVGLAVRSAVSAAQSELAGTGADVKWVEPGNVHLTLRFIGEADEAAAAGLAEAARAAAAGQGPFRLRLGPTGAFPSPREPKVLWYGLAEGAREAEGLAARLEDALERLGYAREQRPFAAHVTIGRMRSHRNTKKLAALLGRPAPESAAGTVDRLLVVESRLSSAGPAYRTVHEVPLHA